MISAITKQQAIKILKAAVYVGVSAGIAYIISLIANNPTVFGALTPIINIILVSLKQLFTEPKE